MVCKEQHSGRLQFTVTKSLILWLDLQNMVPCIKPLRTWRIRSLILPKETDRKVKHKRYKVQFLFYSTGNEVDFSVFNLKITEYMKYISEDREREKMVSCSDSHSLGLRAPAWFEDLHFSKATLFLLFSHDFSNPPLWVAVEMITAPQIGDYITSDQG